MVRRDPKLDDEASDPGPRSPSRTTAVQTVACVDLVRYADKAALLEDLGGVEATLALNTQIQGVIKAAMAASGATSVNLLAHRGDGALLRFETPDQALAFAKSLHAECRRHNETCRFGAAKRRFRVGIATGELVFNAAAPAAASSAGMVIVRAARLEAAAPPGGTLVDHHTHAYLPATQRKALVGPMTLAGKRGERLEAYSAGPGRAVRRGTATSPRSGDSRRRATSRSSPAARRGERRARRGAEAAPPPPLRGPLPRKRVRN
jgi:class 3 adenylate cyclase